MGALTRRQRFAAIAIPALAVVAAGCGADNGGTDDASEDNAITIYSGRDEDLVQPLIDMMAEETGLEIEVRYGDTSQMANQLVEEGERTSADLFLGQDAGALGALVQEGLLAELPPETLDQVAEDFRDDNDHWVGISGRSRVLAYAPDRVEELPDSVLELTDSEWEGRVGIAPTNASFQSFVTALRVIEGEDAARQWLDGMQDNDVQLFENNRAMLDGLENGEIDISLNNHYYWYQRVEEFGADAITAELHYLPGGDAGGLVNVAGAGILASSDNPEGAQTALEYLLSAEAQEYFTQETWEYPLIPGVEVGEGMPELADLEQPDIDLSDLRSLDETMEMIREAGLE